MKISPTVIFKLELTWREIKLIRRALELEGGNGSNLARMISEQLKSTQSDLLEQIKNTNNTKEEI